MPFRVETKVETREKFVHDVLTFGLSRSEACRKFGITRPTGDKWLQRYADEGVAGLADRSRAPESRPGRTPSAIEQSVVRLRADYPSLGPKKLRAVLRRQYPNRDWPAPSTIGAILHRHGVQVREDKRRRRTPASTRQLRTPTHPNETWAIDYKGQFRLGDGQLCYPLTVTDLATRMVLACAAFDAVGGAESRAVLEGLFAKHGLPGTMRSDNGAPFASTGIGGLSALSAWWLSLGVGHERIEPGHPEQNGSHERFHLTLKEETTRPAAQDMAGQQARFDKFLPFFNEFRPHEAIGQRAPAELWTASERRIEAVRRPSYDDCDLVYSVHKGGEFKFRKDRIFLGTALAGHRIGVVELEPEVWLVRFCGEDLGIFEPDDTKVAPLKTSWTRPARRKDEA